MANAGGTQWRAEVERFFDEAVGLVVAGDPRMERAGGMRDAPEVIARWARSAREELWTLQHSSSARSLRRSAPTNAIVRAHGVTVRVVTTTRALVDCPLLPSAVPEVRIGYAARPLFVVDETVALLTGPLDTPLSAYLWATTDPRLVARAVASARACWEHAAPWQVHTDRPALPERTLDVALRLADGQSDREIAEGLEVSPRTAAAEVRRVVDWCGARSRGHAIAILVGADT